MTVEFNGAGWGAVLVRAAGSVISLFADGRATLVGAIVERLAPSDSEALPIPPDLEILNLRLETQGANLFVCNTMSDFELVFAGSSHNVLFRSPAIDAGARGWTEPIEEPHSSSRPPDFFRRWSATGMRPAVAQGGTPPRSRYRSSLDTLLEQLAAPQPTAEPASSRHSDAREWLAGELVRLHAEGLASPAITKTVDAIEKLLSTANEEGLDRLESLRASLSDAVGARRQLAQMLALAEARLRKLEMVMPDALDAARSLFETLERQARRGEEIEVDAIAELDGKLDELHARGVSSRDRTLFEVETVLHGLKRFELPLSLGEAEKRILEHLAKHGDVTRQDVFQTLGRRAPRLLPLIQERLHRAGLDILRVTTSPDGDLWQFNYEELP